MPAHTCTLWGTAAALFLLWASSALADTDTGEVRIECRPNGAVGTHYAAVEVEISKAERELFRDASYVDYFLGVTLTRVEDDCKHDTETTGIALRAYVVRDGEFRATYRGRDGKWTIDSNGIAGSLDREEAEQAAVAQAEQAQRDRAAFIASTGVTQWVASSSLSNNPFQFRGQKIGVVTSFAEMLTEDQALFSEFVVTGVDPNLFQFRGERAVLAIEVTGRAATLTSRGSVSIPTAKLVKAVNCSKQDCSPFLP